MYVNIMYAAFFYFSFFKLCSCSVVMVHELNIRGGYV